MKNLVFLNGSVADPKSIGPQIIAHICNDFGIWTGRNAQEIARAWPGARSAFEAWYRNRSHNDFGLGSVQFVNVNKTHVNRVVRVANMVGQRGTRHKMGARPIRYKVLAQCLSRVAERAKRMHASVHLPQLGLNGSDLIWPMILDIIKDSVGRFKVPIYIYIHPVDTTDEMFARVMNPPRPKRFELVDLQRKDCVYFRNIQWRKTDRGDEQSDDEQSGDDQSREQA